MDFEIKLGGYFDKNQIQTELNKLTGLKLKLDIDTTQISQKLKDATKNINLSGIKTGVSANTITGTTSGVTLGGNVSQTTTFLNNQNEITSQIVEKMTDLNNVTTEYYNINKDGELELSRQTATKTTQLEEELKLRKKINKEIEDTKYRLQELQNKGKLTSSDVSGFNTRVGTIDTTGNLESLQNSDRVIKSINKDISEQARLIAQNESHYYRLSKALESYGNQGKLSTKEISVFQQKLDTINNSTDEIGKNKSFDKLNSDIVSAANSTGLLGQSLGKAIVKYTTWLGIATIVSKIMKFIKSVVNEVYKLDTALTELNKVADLTKKELQDITQQAYNAATEVHSTGLEILAATTEFKKMGYEIKNALDLAKVATIMTNIAEGLNSSSEAATILISVLKGTGISAEYAERVLDKLNEVSNNNAIGFDNLARMLQTTSSTMSVLGNTIDETIGLLTGAFEVIQDERVAKGLSTIGLRIAGLNEDLSEELGLTNDINKSLEKYAGISIFDEQSGQLRSTYDILSDLAEVWDTLSINAQATILTKLGGKGRADIASALLTNWEAVKKAVDDAQNSLGSAAKENERYADSIEGRLQTLRNTWSEIKTNFVESDFFKDILDFLSSVSTIIKNLNLDLYKTLAILGSVAMAIGAFTANAGLFAIGATMGVIGLGGTITKESGIGAKGSTNETTGEDTTNIIDEDKQKAIDEYNVALKQLKDNLYSLGQEQSELIKLEEEKNKQLKIEKDLNEKILAVQQARENLDKAKENRTIRTYRVGKGFVYEADEEEIESAQKSLEEAINTLTETQYDISLDRAKSFIEEMNEILQGDDATVGWNDLFDKYQDIANTKFSNILTSAQQFVKEFNETVGEDNKIDLTSTGKTSGLNVNYSSNDLGNVSNASDIVSSGSLSNLSNYTGVSYSGAKNIVLNFSGDLSFPNISSGENAKDFISALLEIGNNKIPNLN